MTSQHPRNRKRTGQKSPVYRPMSRHWDGDAIRALRAHLGVTQSELAEELGVRQQTVSEWETGVYQPRGASVTLLGMVAERASFTYRADSSVTETPEGRGDAPR